MTLVLALLTAVGLAASAGLRAFLPLFGVGLAARFLDLPIAESVDWLATDAALLIFGVATLVEIVADKVPVVDHALDLAHTVLGPAAGIVASFGVLAQLPAPFALALAIIAGGAVAGTVHAAAATTRVKSTALTGGTANPVLSVIEDVMAIAGVVVAIVVPVLVLLLVVVLFLWLRRRRARRAAVAAA